MTVTDLIPIVLGTVSMMMTLGIVLGAFYFSYKKRQQAHLEILAAIEKGIDVPLQRVQSESNYRTRGYLWTSLGIALTLAIYFSSDDFGAASWGLIPTAAGIAFLLIARGDSDKDPAS